jgi:hypothetical protein
VGTVISFSFAGVSFVLIMSKRAHEEKEEEDEKEKVELVPGTETGAFAWLVSAVT